MRGPGWTNGNPTSSEFLDMFVVECWQLLPSLALWLQGRKMLHLRIPVCQEQRMVSMLLLSCCKASQQLSECPVRINAQWGNELIACIHSCF